MVVNGFITNAKQKVVAVFVDAVDAFVAVAVAVVAVAAVMLFLLLLLLQRCDFVVVAVVAML